MRILKSHSRYILIAFAFIALAMPVCAQVTVKQNSTTVLSVEPQANVNYTWEIFHDDIHQFVGATSNVGTNEAEFLANINTGAAVSVTWKEAGTYFYKVTATYNNGCTNNIKVGQLIVSPSEAAFMVDAINDYQEYKCEPIYIDITANDLIDATAVSYSVRLLDPSWSVEGEIELSENSILSYTNENPSKQSVDSIRYELTAYDNNNNTSIDTATVYIQIGDADCHAPMDIIANDDKYTVQSGVNELSVTENDIYDSNLEVSVNIIEWPSRGTLDFIDNKTFSYVPNSNSKGGDRFKYEIYYDSIPDVYDVANVDITIPELGNNTETDTVYHLFIPEAFTPNGDGVHDYFVVDGVEMYPNASMKVYTREGHLIFKRDNYGNTDYWGEGNHKWWDGTDASGNPVIAGVYLYVYDTGGKLVRGFVMVAYGSDQIGN